MPEDRRDGLIAVQMLALATRTDPGSWSEDEDHRDRRPGWPDEALRDGLSVPGRTGC